MTKTSRMRARRVAPGLALWLLALSGIAPGARAQLPFSEPEPAPASAPAAAPVVPDTALPPYNPYPARIAGWSLAAVGLGMAVYGVAPRDDGESCELIMGFSCDEDRRRTQLWLFFGGAAIGSVGVLTAWSAERELDRRAALRAARAPAAASASSACAGEPKNPWIGMGLGLAGAAAGTALFWNDPGPVALFAAIAAPSAGQFYAGTLPATAIALAVRGTAGFLQTRGSLDRAFGNDEGESDRAAERGLYVAGTAISLFDIWGALQADASSRRAEGAPAPGRLASVTLAPALFAVDTRRVAPGLALALRW